MGYLITIKIETLNGDIITKTKFCYQFKKTKLYKRLINQLNKNQIKSFKYGYELPF